MRNILKNLTNSMKLQNIKEALKISSIPIVIASLCCLSPVILVTLGIASVSFASSLADIFYGEYKWYFRAAGVISLLISFIFYIRRNLGVCSIDEAVQRRNELINKLALAIIIGVTGYFIFLYVIVEYIGIILKIWE